MDPQLRQLLIMAAIGIVAGWLASIVVGGSGILQYLVSGVLGAFVGGYLFQFMGWKLGIGNPLVEQILIAAIGAMIVTLVGRMVFG